MSVEKRENRGQSQTVTKLSSVVTASLCQAAASSAVGITAIAIVCDFANRLKTLGTLQQVFLSANISFELFPAKTSSKHFE